MLCWHSGDCNRACSHIPSWSPTNPGPGEGAQDYTPAGHRPPRSKSFQPEAESGAEAEAAAQGGVCLSPTDRQQPGTAPSTGLSAAPKMLQYNFKTKAISASGWWGGGPSVAHPSRRKDFFSPLRSSHPSEKVPLLPVFYETPTHQPSNCSQHVLRFYVSNKKQLHLHKTCFFSSRLSLMGGTTSLPEGLFLGLSCSLGGTAQRHGDTRKQPFPSSFSAYDCQNDTTSNL